MLWVLKCPFLDLHSRLHISIHCVLLLWPISVLLGLWIYAGKSCLSVHQSGSWSIHLPYDSQGIQFWNQVCRRKVVFFLILQYVIILMNGCFTLCCNPDLVLLQMYFVIIFLTNKFLCNNFPQWERKREKIPCIIHLGSITKSPTNILCFDKCLNKTPVVFQSILPCTSDIL